MGCQNVELESGRKRANSLMCGVHKSHLRSRSRNMSRVPWCVRSLDGLSLWSKVPFDHCRRRSLEINLMDCAFSKVTSRLWRIPCRIWCRKWWSHGWRIRGVRSGGRIGSIAIEAGAFPIDDDAAEDAELANCEVVPGGSGRAGLGGACRGRVAGQGKSAVVASRLCSMLKRMNLSNSCEKQEEIHDVEKSEVSTIDPKKPIRGGREEKKIAESVDRE